MRMAGILNTASGALRRNVMRTLLTTLGIVIGVGAVITMMEIGNGATLAIQRTLTAIGANTLVVIPGAQFVGGINYGIGSMTTLTPQDADAISRECPAVASVAPIVRARTQIVYGNRNWSPRTCTAPRRLSSRCATGPRWPRATRSPSTTSATPARSASWAKPS